MTALTLREPVKAVADIIQAELDLDSGRVVLENQKVPIKSDSGLWVMVAYVSGKAIGNQNYAEATADGMNEIQSVTMHHLIRIDVMSYDSSARTRKEEVLMALRSVYSQEKQGLYNMQIARIPGEFLNLSELEESAMLNRYSVTVAVTSLYTKTKSLNYYDQFTDPVVHPNA